MDYEQIKSFYNKKSDDSLGKLTYKEIIDEYNRAYSNPQSGDTDIYWVDSKIIDEYRNKSR